MTDSLITFKQGIQGSHLMRNGALERLTDADLQFSTGGDAVSLGDLFKSLGELQHTYIQSFKTLKHDWSYRNHENGLSESVSQLQAWFTHLDQNMMQTLEHLTADDLTKEIDRGNGVTRNIEAQLEIYVQALLIFFGKLVIYFQTMQKPLPDSIQHYFA